MSFNPQLKAATTLEAASEVMEEESSILHLLGVLSPVQTWEDREDIVQFAVSGYLDVWLSCGPVSMFCTITAELGLVTFGTAVR